MCLSCGQHSQCLFLQVYTFALCKPACIVRTSKRGHGEYKKPTHYKMQSLQENSCGSYKTMPCSGIDLYERELTDWLCNSIKYSLAAQIMSLLQYFTCSPLLDQTNPTLHATHTREQYIYLQLGNFELTFWHGIDNYIVRI